jgi:hypothetical protein
MEMKEDVLGAPDRVAVLEPSFRQTPADLEGGDQARGLGRSDTGVSLELDGERAREPVQTLGSEELTSQRAGRATARARPQQECEELGVIERLRTVAAQPLARSLPVS